MGSRTQRGGFSEHLFAYRSVAKQKLILSLSITSAVMVVEVIGGVVTGSMALISDAGHMFTHSFALVTSLIAIGIARKPPCHHRTFGLYRAEILAAFVNGLFLLVVVGVIIYEAVLRIVHPEEILGLQMLLVALVGLGVNLASVLILKGSHEVDLNVRSVFTHMMADAASSVGVIAAAVVIYYTGWNVIDPLVSLGISGVILYWAWGVLKDAGKILLEMAPTGLNVDLIGADLKTRFPEIGALYNMHLWTITTEMLVFSAHVKLNDAVDRSHPEQLVRRMNAYLCEEYKIIESTIQVIS